MADRDCSLISSPGYAQHMRLPEGRWVLHRPTSQPVATAVGIRSVTGVLGISVQCRGPVRPQDRIALIFATQLREVHPLRVRELHRAGAAIVSTTPAVPAATRDMVSLFHLRPVGAQHSTTMMLWDWVVRTEAEYAFGGALPDMRFLTRYLPDLIDAHRAVMAGTRPYTPALDELVHALGGGQLSGAFVLYHHELLLEVLTELRSASSVSSADGESRSVDQPTEPAQIGRAEADR
ncbi:hypothetical protein [Kibdelosporangium phytohabitans]|uniref:hypothetical protein n=1 Tax=Kibdelosporangium phytohabitans TaxID=860235 RepID=UPI0012F70C3D|nr:hypothetical protein [Kibdelosporangium phytohabitans]MBE1467568.1 hypothetical protein [Kibdelosporangium phytohabitans]